MALNTFWFLEVLKQPQNPDSVEHCKTTNTQSKC